MLYIPFRVINIVTKRKDVLKMTELEKAINWYNKILFDIGREHRTIGTKHSYGTEGWGIAEMVEEAKHWLSWYYEPGVNRGDFPLGEAYRLKRFIKRYEVQEPVPEASEQESTEEQEVAKPEEEEPAEARAKEGDKAPLERMTARYNRLMWDTAQPQLTIGTGYGYTEAKSLSWMVGTVRFVLDQCMYGRVSDGVQRDKVIRAMRQFIKDSTVAMRA